MARQGASLGLKTQMLCRGGTVFMNGEAEPVDAGFYAVLRQLADARALPAVELPAELSELLYRWYLDGYLVPGLATV